MFFMRPTVTPSDELETLDMQQSVCVCVYSQQRKLSS